MIGVWNRQVRPLGEPQRHLQNLSLASVLLVTVELEAELDESFLRARLMDSRSPFARVVYGTGTLSPRG